MTQARPAPAAPVGNRPEPSRTKVALLAALVACGTPEADLDEGSPPADPPIPAGPLLSVEGCTVHDGGTDGSLGDGDGVVEVGEVVKLVVAVRNAGSSAAARWQLVAEDGAAIDFAGSATVDRDVAVGATGIAEFHVLVPGRCTRDGPVRFTARPDGATSDGAPQGSFDVDVRCPVGPTVVDDAIFDATWTAARSPYVVTGDAIVLPGSRLTIEPGVAVKLEADASLVIAGVLDAIGTADLPIAFTSSFDDDYGGDTNGDGAASSPTPGDWGGLSFVAGSAAELQHVVVRYGGLDAVAVPMITIQSDDVSLAHASIERPDWHALNVGGADPTVFDTYVEGADSDDSYAIFVHSGASPTFAGNLISGGGTSVFAESGEPVFLDNELTHATHGIVLAGASAAVSDNHFRHTGTGVHVTSSAGSPTIVDNAFAETAVPIRLGAYAEDALVTGNHGTGNEVDAIVVDSVYGARTLAHDNALAWMFGALYVEAGASLSIDRGVVLKAYDAHSEIQVYGALEAVGTPSDPVVFTSRYDRFAVDTGQDDKAASPMPADWRRMYFAPDSTANLQHVVIRYGGNAEDGAKQPMVEIAGDAVALRDSTLAHAGWHALHIAADPVVAGCHVDGRAGAADSCAAWVQDGAPVLSRNTLTAAHCGATAIGGNPTFSDNLFLGGQSGLTLEDTAATVVGNRFTDNATGLAVYGADGEPSVLDNAFTGNTARAMLLDTLTENTTVIGNSGIGDGVHAMVLRTVTGARTLSHANRLAWMFDAMEVELGASLSVDVGVVLKGWDHNSEVRVYGALDAAGTPAEPVVFTSRQDASVGMHVGGASPPAAGHWRRIAFEPGSTGKLYDTVVRFGGQHVLGADHAMVEVRSDSVMLRDGRFTNSAWHTLAAHGASPTVIGSHFEGSNAPDELSAVRLEASDAVLMSNTFAAEHIGAHVIGGAPTFIDNDFRDTRTGVYLQDSRATVRDNRFTRNATGLEMRGPSGAPRVTGNAFTRNTSQAMLVRTLTEGTVLTGNGGTGNGLDAMILGTVHGARKLGRANDLAWMFDVLSIAEGAAVSVDAGVAIKARGAESEVVVVGSLAAGGTPEAPVVFTSRHDDSVGIDVDGDRGALAPTAGDWRRMSFEPTSAATLAHTVVRYGGYYGDGADYPMVEVASDEVALRNAELTDSAWHALAIDAASPTFASSRFEGHNDHPLSWAVSVDLGSPVFTGNTFTGEQVGAHVVGGAPAFSDNVFEATVTGLVLRDSTAVVQDNQFARNTTGLAVSGAAGAPTVTNNAFIGNTAHAMSLDTLTEGTVVVGNTGSSNGLDAMVVGTVHGERRLSNANGLAWMFDALEVHADAALAVDPGIALKALDRDSEIAVYGGLDAVGTPSEPVVITSRYDDVAFDVDSDGGAAKSSEGDWRRVYFAPGSRGTVAHAFVRYGGYSGDGIDHAMVQIDSDAVVLRDSTLSTSAWHLVATGDSSPEVLGCDLSGTGERAIDVGAGAPRIDDNRITESGWGVYVVGGSPEVTANTVALNGTGIYVSGAGANPLLRDNDIAANGHGVYATGFGEPRLRGNALVGNATAGVTNTSGTVTIDATDNWWGHASGPRHPVANHLASGDDVTDGVDFDDWLDESPRADEVPPEEVMLTSVRALPWDKSVELTWNNPRDADFHHVRIERSHAGGAALIADGVGGGIFVDTDLAYDVPYQYAVYAVDGSDNASAGVVGSVTVPDPAPDRLRLTVTDTQISAHWRRSPVAPVDLAGYRVFYGPSPSAMVNELAVGTSTTATILGLTNGVRYWVQVVAESPHGHASAPVVESTIARL